MEVFENDHRAWRTFARLALQGSAYLRDLNPADRRFALNGALSLSPERAIHRLGVDAGRPARLVRTAHRRCNEARRALGDAFMVWTAPKE